MVVKHTFAWLVCILSLSGCDTISTLTAVNHKSHITDSTEVLKFNKKSGFGELTTLCYEPKYFETSAQIPHFPLYDQSGKYIALDTDIGMCKDEKSFYYAQLKELLKGNIEVIYKDSISVRTRQLIQSPNPDSIGDYWESKTIVYSTDMKNLTEHLVSLEGEKVDISMLYNQFIIFKEYSIFGKSKLDAIVIRDLKNQIEQLNLSFGDEISLVLINIDRLHWMKYD